MKARRITPFIRGVTGVGIAVTTLNTATLIRRPNAPNLLTSLLTTPQAESTDIQQLWWALIPAAGLQCYIWLGQWSAVYLYSTVAIAYISTVQHALEVLRWTDRMSIGRFRREHRTLEVLQCNMNDLVRWLMWAEEVILITTVVFGLCGSVWAEGFRSIRLFIVAAFALSFLVTIWTGLGALYESSVEVLTVWKAQTGLPLDARKFLRSTRPIRVEIGSYFYADRPLVLTLLGVITENTFNVLLAA